MTEVGCFAALFGILFGSFFGWEGLFDPLWFSPMHNIPLLMVAALAVGVGLMTGGMVLRVVNGLRQEPASTVLTDRYGVAGMSFYLGSLILGYLVYRSLVPPASLALLVLPLAAVFFHPFTEAGEKEGTPAYLLCAEGSIEVLETVLGFLANTFSFLRVAAFGLAHVGLSLAVYALAEQAMNLPLGIVFAGLVHLIGNLVILVLEGLIVSIQTVRLEFYEFFGKFFRGGGIRFNPLALDPFAERRL
jgi:V/A-type H+-transporting ATPase subunit I